MDTKEGMDDSSRYALGALLSLALHLQEVSIFQIPQQFPFHDCLRSFAACSEHAH